MSRSSLRDVDCSVAQTLELIGEWWTLMILRNAFHGMRNFDAFQQNLGISTSILSARLKKLCEAGILDKRPSPVDGRAYEYRLTERGLDLYPILVGLTEWGEKHHPNGRGRRQILREKATGRAIAGVAVLSQSGRPLRPREVCPEAGPGADDKLRELIAYRRPGV